jgi:catechol 2,3-dioxygenase-like lactoylglutathione lyase family enzyme
VTASQRVRFDHVAIALRRMADAPALLVGVLGGRSDAGGASDSFAWSAWRFAGGGAVEVIEPRGDDGFLHRFLAQRGPGIHHVTFRVPSLAAACARAAAHGYEVVGRDESDPGWMTAYLHPRQALGIVVQLAESSITAGTRSACGLAAVAASGGGAGRRPRAAPSGPPDPPPPVTILGLRMRAHSVDRARVQWRDVLCGQLEADDERELTFAWPGSAMRLVVEIDPRRDEGPVAIEFASERPIPDPAQAHPLLGVLFRPAPVRRHGPPS